VRYTPFAAATVAIAVFLACDAAFAQDTGTKWDLEVHAGFSSTLNQQEGLGSLPSTGTIVSGEISASTFYLGDGARLFNDNQRAVVGGQGAQIVPIDTLLLNSMITRQAGPAVGVRLRREIASRFAAEIDGDASLDHLTFTPAALASIETTRASYATALQRALLASPLPSAVASDATVTSRRFSPQLFATGAFVVKLRTSGKAIPYAVGGGGVMLNQGDTPSVTLEGNYSVDKPAQLLGTDTVSITYDENSMNGVGFGGAGFTYDVKSRWGIRVDAREYFYKNSSRNIVTVTPSLGFQSTGQPFPLVNVGDLRFATSSPLNGPPPETSTTFTGSGLQAHLIVSAGLVVRF